MKRGLFIVLEGIDGSGTTTQTNRLDSYIKNLPNHYNLLATHEPWKTKEIKEMLEKDKDAYSNGEKMIHLYIKDRKKHLQDLIEPFLDIGGIVLCDTYHISTFARQRIEGISIGKIKRIHNAEKIPNPDLTFFLDVNLDTAQKRILERKKPSEKFEKDKEFIQKLIENYRNLVQMGKENPAFLGPIVTINGNSTIQEVAKDIQEGFNSIYNKWLIKTK